MRIAAPLLSLLAMPALVLAVASCGDSGPPVVEVRKAFGDPEFARHLRLGKEQLRHHLTSSARAELERCDSLWPGEPEVLLQMARLAVFEDRGEEQLRAGRELLERALAEDPDSVRAHRLLFEFCLAAGDVEGADRAREAVEDLYGQLGVYELDVLAETFRQGELAKLKMPEPWKGDYGVLASSLRRLLRFGQLSSPDAAVKAIEDVMQRYPDLAILRFVYAQFLVKAQVRVTTIERPGLPKASSVLIYDLAQSHVEAVLDQVMPFSPLAKKATELLKLIATRMADYEESLTFADILLEWPGVLPAERGEILKRKGLCYFKQGRPGLAIEALEQALTGLEPGGHEDLSTRWLLHLARDAEGSDWSGLDAFPFREDLALPGDRPDLVYRDIAPELGVNKVDGGSPSAWGDYDGDGDYDLFISGNDSFGTLFRNDEGKFVDATREAGLFHLQSGFGATFADYDNDGDVDLYMSRDGWRGPAPNSLLRNDGDGTFSDVTDEAGVGDPGSSFTHAWSDVDLDGDLDLMIADGITGGGDVNTFYRNNGDGTFVDDTEGAGLLEPTGVQTIGVAFGDYDNDGWPDLFASGWMRPNRLYHNRGDGTFEEVADQAGVSERQNTIGGYVCFFLDYDNDGWLDILRANQAPWRLVLLGISSSFDSMSPELADELASQTPQLYRNNRDGTFENVSVAAGLVHPIGAMGAAVADIDNDGHMDLFFGTGDPDMARLEPDRFYHNNGDGTFSDLSFAAGLWNVGKGHGLSFNDWDLDGDLELYSAEGGFVHGDSWPNAFYENTAPSENHWLHVDLEGVESNRFGIGTRALVQAGDMTVLRIGKSGEGFGSSNTPTLEFGLGAEDRVDRLEVRWPGGTVQTFENLAADQRIVIREGEDWRPWEREGRD